MTIACAPSFNCKFWHWLVLSYQKRQWLFQMSQYSGCERALWEHNSWTAQKLCHCRCLKCEKYFFTFLSLLTIWRSLCCWVRYLLWFHQHIIHRMYAWKNISTKCTDKIDLQPKRLFSIHLCFVVWLVTIGACVISANKAVWIFAAMRTATVAGWWVRVAAHSLFNPTKL